MTTEKSQALKNVLRECKELFQDKGDIEQEVFAQHYENVFNKTPITKSVNSKLLKILQDYRVGEEQEKQSADELFFGAKIAVAEEAITKHNMLKKGGYLKKVEALTKEISGYRDAREFAEMGDILDGVSTGSPTSSRSPSPMIVPEGESVSKMLANNPEIKESLKQNFEKKHPKVPPTPKKKVFGLDKGNGIIV